jgi:secondary thiamine-phosphate synthase enzyme
MKVIQKRISISSTKEGDMIDLTDDVQRALESTDVKDGVVTVFVAGSTGAVTTIEYEPGLLHDFPAMLERVAPKNMYYEHEMQWHDGNGHSHVRASLIGPSLTVPFKNQRLTLGTWQQIVFVELDARSRNREIILQILGE